MMVREQVAAYIRQNYHRTGRPPSVRTILKALGLNREKFYREFPSGLDEACKSAGVKAAGTKAMVEKALATRRANVEHGHQVLYRQRYQQEVREYSERLLEMEYAARLDSSRIGQFAAEVLPKIDQNLWHRFTLMSGGGLEKAYREAVSICGEYLDLVKEKIAKGVTFKDDGKAYRSYLIEITSEWLENAINEGRGTLLPPGRANSHCLNCDAKLEYCSDGSIKCPICREKSILICEICMCEMKFQEATKLLRCMRCGYRLGFDEEILHELTEDYLKIALRSYLGTGRADPRLKNYEIMYCENRPDGKKFSIPLRELLR